MSNPGNMNVNSMIAAINAGNVDNVSAEQIGKLEGKEKTLVVQALKNYQGENKGKVAKLLREVEGGGGSGSGTVLSKRGVEASSSVISGREGARKGYIPKAVDVHAPFRGHFTLDRLRELLEKHRGQRINLSLNGCGRPIDQACMEVLLEYKDYLTGLNIWGRDRALILASGIEFSEGERRAFFEGLGQLPHLTSLDLGRNSLGQLGGLGGGAMRAFFEVLEKLPQLTSLGLGCNDLGQFSEGDIKELFEVLGMLPQLISLDLGDNHLGQFGEGAMRALFKGLGKLSVLRSLSLGDSSMNRLGEGDIKELFEELAKLPQLTSLDLRGNDLGQFGEGAMRALFEGLGKLSELRSLNILFEDLTDRQVEEISTLLPGCEIEF